jgi:hypothetical protein
MMYGRDIAVLSQIVFGTPSSTGPAAVVELLDRGLEQLGLARHGRPHWGKWHEAGVTALRPAYPRFDDFVGLRAQLDPHGLFMNNWLRTQLGVPPPRFAGAIAGAITTGRSAWTGSGVTVVSTNAPVLRWASMVQSRGTFSYSVDVADATGTAVWSSGEVWQGNWPIHSPAFPGLCVYEGPSLVPGATYSFAVTEQQAADGTGKNVSTRWAAGSGRFQAHSELPSAQAELIAQLHSANMTQLWNASSTSIWSRVEPSGFLPTSVSGGYGGITSEFVRDAAGMTIGMLELGPEHWPTARKAMRFMLHGLQCTQNEKVEAGCSIGEGMVRNPPEVLTGDCPEAARTAGTCAYNTKIVGVNANEETDGAFYVIAAWGRLVAVTGDASLEEDFFATLKTYHRLRRPRPYRPPTRLRARVWRPGTWTSTFLQEHRPSRALGPPTGTRASGCSGRPTWSTAA